jgi:anti-anti-sigma factor
MLLDIKVIKKRDFAYTVELKGLLDTETHGELEEELKEIINKETKAVVLDMGGLTYISSAGIGTVMWAKKALSSKGASFAMTNLKPQIKKVFEAMRIMPVVDILANAEEADKYIDQIIKDETEKQKSAHN